MKVSKAIVILSKHTADCIVFTIEDKPSSMPGVTSEPLTLMAYAEYDKGLEYVKANFPDVPISVVARPH